MGKIQSTSNAALSEIYFVWLSPFPPPFYLLLKEKNKSLFNRTPSEKRPKQRNARILKIESSLLLIDSFDAMFWRD